MKKFILCKNHCYDKALGVVSSTNLESLIKEAERYIIPVEIFEVGEDGTIWSGKRVWSKNV